MAAPPEIALEEQHTPATRAPEPDDIEVVRRNLRALVGLESGSLEIIVQKPNAVSPKLSRVQRQQPAR
ncbi:MAG TPA: hypothetical protein VHY09_09410 [Candidatus Methylacidiphilales bacterium]|jgi:hypothetical protein|nr:hypothetical protein [Candidatus Methylacidiphilales bacterium]